MDVKPDPDQPEPLKQKAVPKASPHELHMYSADELAGFKKREMVADAELLDGKPDSKLAGCYLINYPRKVEECKTKHERSKGVQET